MTILGKITAQFPNETKGSNYKKLDPFCTFALFMCSLYNIIKQNLGGLIMKLTYTKHGDFFLPDLDRAVRTVLGEDGG